MEKQETTQENFTSMTELEKLNLAIKIVGHRIERAVTRARSEDFTIENKERTLAALQQLWAITREIKMDNDQFKGAVNER